MTETNNSRLRITRLLELAQTDPNILKELERFRRTLVVMFSDIQGSTNYFEKHGDAAGLLMVHRCNDTVRCLVEKQGGAVVKTIGDGTMATFPEPRRAVEAAIEIQSQVSAFSGFGTEAERVSLRIGMHYGTGIVRSNNDVFGDVVNMAARVESVATAGQIVVSEEIWKQVHECGFSIHELGQFKLKGKSGERRLYQVIWAPAPGVPTEYGVAQSDLAAAPFFSFRLQLVYKDGREGPEYAVQSELAVRLTKEGVLLISNDVDSPSMRARVFVQEQSLFVEERSAAGEGVFLRLANPYPLEHQDMFLAGNQVFRYEERSAPAAGATKLSVLEDAPGEIDTGAGDMAELVRTGTQGNTIARYQLNAPEVQFGRSVGTYVFPSDNLMSRSHFRILQRAEDFVLEDIGSRNGTFVKMRGTTRLPSGSALLIAGQLLRVIH